MDLNHILDEEKRIRRTIKSEYVDSTDKSAPIYDGIVNPEQYVSSSPRILWLLKEPYCGGDAYEGGDWSLSDLLNNDADRMSRQKAFQPICYIGFGIWKEGYRDWDKMPWLKDCEEIRTSLRKIAFINISKLPGLKTTPSARITEAYHQHRGHILDQIKTYAPDIVFACNPHVQLLLPDLLIANSRGGASDFAKPEWKWFASDQSHQATAAAVQISSKQRLVWVDHPSARTNRRNYVNDAIMAATADLDAPEPSKL